MDDYIYNQKIYLSLFEIISGKSFKILEKGKKHYKVIKKYKYPLWFRGNKSPLYWNYFWKENFFSKRVFPLVLTVDFFVGYSNRKSSKIYWNLQSIQADFNSVMVCVVTILPLICRSVCVFLRSFGTLPRAPSTIGATIFIFYSFFGIFQGPNIFLLFRFILFSSKERKIH